MKKPKPVVARNTRELAKVLGLSPADRVEIEFQVVTKKGLTHSDVARLAHTSRTRVTAILNRNTHDISTNLMLRLLASLGVQMEAQRADHGILETANAERGVTHDLSYAALGIWV